MTRRVLMTMSNTHTQTPIHTHKHSVCYPHATFCGIFIPEIAVSFQSYLGNALSKALHQLHSLTHRAFHHRRLTNPSRTQPDLVRDVVGRPFWKNVQSSCCCCCYCCTPGTDDFRRTSLLVILLTCPPVQFHTAATESLFFI